MAHTIFALATAAGKAGVSVIRISGPSAFAAGEALYKTPCAPRKASLRKLYTSNGELIDEALILTFAEGESFTGEPVVELQTHGSPAVVTSVLNALSQIEDCRSAEPGEFTRRALENDRMDLSQIEGLGDLIDAETEAQRKQALRVMQGGLSDQVEIWRSSLIRAVALIEATIDFADEDVPVDVTPEVLDLISKVETSLQSEIDGSFIAERIHDGFEVAIVGKPNIGKSTLLNKIAGRDAALTSEFEGTTRDIIEVRFDLNGVPVTFLDTAGIRETSDHVEGLGIERAKQRAEAADIRVFLQSDEDQTLPFQSEPHDIILNAKSDLAGENSDNSISGKTGSGIDKLLNRLSVFFESQVKLVNCAIKQRHRAEMEAALISLTEAKDFISQGDEFADLTAYSLHNSINCLNSLVGRVDIEQVLGEIFASFCLGK